MQRLQVLARDKVPSATTGVLRNASNSVPAILDADSLRRRLNNKEELEPPPKLISQKDITAMSSDSSGRASPTPQRSESPWAQRMKEMMSAEQEKRSALELAEKLKRARNGLTQEKTPYQIEAERRFQQAKEASLMRLQNAASKKKGSPKSAFTNKKMKMDQGASSVPPASAISLSLTSNPPLIHGVRVEPLTAADIQMKQGIERSLPIQTDDTQKKKDALDAEFVMVDD